jgi:hypothetical protein
MDTDLYHRVQVVQSSVKQHSSDALRDRVEHLEKEVKNVLEGQISKRVDQLEMQATQQLASKRAAVGGWFVYFCVGLQSMLWFLLFTQVTTFEGYSR